MSLGDKKKTSSNSYTPCSYLTKHASAVVSSFLRIARASSSTVAKFGIRSLVVLLASGMAAWSQRAVSLLLC